MNTAFSPHLVSSDGNQQTGKLGLGSAPAGSSKRWCSCPPGMPWVSKPSSAAPPSLQLLWWMKRGSWMSSLETVHYDWGLLDYFCAEKAGHCRFHLELWNEKQDYIVQTLSTVISPFLASEKTDFKWFAQVHMLRSDTGLLFQRSGF